MSQRETNRQRLALRGMRPKERASYPVIYSHSVGSPTLVSFAKTRTGIEARIGHLLDSLCFQLFTRCSHRCTHSCCKSSLLSLSCSTVLRWTCACVMLCSYSVGRSSILESGQTYQATAGLYLSYLHYISTYLNLIGGMTNASDMASLIEPAMAILHSHCLFEKALDRRFWMKISGVFAPALEAQDRDSFAGQDTVGILSSLRDVVPNCSLDRRNIRIIQCLLNNWQGWARAP